jgi:hypothetical protein
VVVDVGGALGTIFRSDTEWEGDFSVVFSPQWVKTTVPWMDEDPPAAPGLVTSSTGRGDPVVGT